MSWAFAKKKDLPGIRTLLSAREWECATLTHRLLCGGSYRLPASGQARLALRRENGDIGQVLYMTKSGVVIPYLPGLPLANPVEGEALREIFQQAWGKACIVIGLEPYLLAFSAWAGIEPIISVEYYLMVNGGLSREAPSREALSRQAQTPPRAEIPKLEIRWAKAADLCLILPMQEAYEKEEILFHEDDFSISKTRSELKLNLKTQLICLGFYEGQLIAKAGTNARGFTIDQIGGVYTRPDFRDKKIARTLVAHLMRHIFANGKTACLFVKKQNSPAIRLYSNLGFRIAENYRISYF
jgi:ribosomal protein S18 acetylase RimI-like enzyme